jgi:hypothetical protein
LRVTNTTQLGIINKGGIMKTLTLAVIGVFAATAASAQSPPPCSGHRAEIRTVAIKSGKRDEFLKSVSDEQAWLRARGSKIQVLLDRVLDESGPQRLNATDLAIMIYVTPTNAVNEPPITPQQRLGQGAFLTEYDDSVASTSSMIVCVPN